VEFNPKAAAVAAGIAFVVSFILGFFSGAGISFVIMRALLFAAMFFVFAALINIVFNKFLAGHGGTTEIAGDIDSGDAQIFEGAVVEESDGFNGAGLPEKNYDDNAQHPLEQNNDTGYTEKENTGFSLNASDFVPGIPGVDESASASESSSSVQIEEGTVDMSVSKSPGKNIEMSDLGKDVDGKKVARAIQTLLKKDDS
jgi:hypothetical protein